MVNHSRKEKSKLSYRVIEEIWENIRGELDAIGVTGIYKYPGNVKVIKTSKRKEVEEIINRNQMNFGNKLENVEFVEKSKEEDRKRVEAEIELELIKNRKRVVLEEIEKKRKEEEILREEEFLKEYRELLTSKVRYREEYLVKYVKGNMKKGIKIPLQYINILEEIMKKVRSILVEKMIKGRENGIVVSSLIPIEGGGKINKIINEVNKRIIETKKAIKKMTIEEKRIILLEIYGEGSKIENDIYWNPLRLYKYILDVEAVEGPLGLEEEWLNKAGRYIGKYAENIL